MRIIIFLYKYGILYSAVVICHFFTWQCIFVVFICQYIQLLAHFFPQFFKWLHNFCFFLCWVFTAAWAFSSCSKWGLLSVVVCGLLIVWLLLLQSAGSRAWGLQYLQHIGSLVVTPRLNCSTECGIFLDQGLNPCPPSMAGFPGGASGKEPGCWCRRHNETSVRSLGWKDPLDKGMATHSSIFAWRIPWTEESIMVKESDTTEAI